MWGKDIYARLVWNMNINHDLTCFYHLGMTIIIISVKPIWNDTIFAIKRITMKTKTPLMVIITWPFDTHLLCSGHP